MGDEQEWMVDYRLITRTTKEDGAMIVRIETHKDLSVWKRAMDMAESIYRLTGTFPLDERYGLISQMRRAAVSVPSNIAEGAARSSSPEFIRFLTIARGSLSELETQLMLVSRLEMAVISDNVFDEVRVIRQMLIALVRSLNKRKL
jgi:four helix bundle protein